MEQDQAAAPGQLDPEDAPEQPAAEAIKEITTSPPKVRY